MTLHGLTASQEADYTELISIVSQWKRLGEKKYPRGTILIGHVPHVAPLAYMHYLFGGLLEAEINDLEIAIKLSIPSSFRTFLSLHNGINLYSRWLSIFGLRKSFKRADLDEAMQQPFSLILPNTIGPPINASNEVIIIGSLGHCRESVVVWPDGSVGTSQEDGQEFKASYRDVFAFLVREARVLDLQFDEIGRRFDGADLIQMER